MTQLYWIIFIAVMVLSLIVQMTLERRFKKYSKFGIAGGLTGADVARKMLRDHGISNVTVQHVDGQLTDHYNPETLTLNLSDSVYNTSSIAAAAVAAHECGHAIQHKYGYGPLRMRSALVPAVSFANKWVMWILLLGILFINTFPSLIWIGIGLFALCTLFSFVTLPVEINASRRAVAWLESARIADSYSLPMAQDALKWAAYTYVIAAISSLATLLYYIAIATSGDRR